MRVREGPLTDVCVLSNAIFSRSTFLHLGLSLCLVRLLLLRFMTAPHVIELAKNTHVLIFGTENNSFFHRNTGDLPKKKKIQMGYCVWSEFSPGEHSIKSIEIELLETKKYFTPRPLSTPREYLTLWQGSDSAKSLCHAWITRGNSLHGLISRELTHQN